MKNYRLYWDAVNGWLIDVDCTLSDQQLKHICKWAIPRQISRWNSLPIGEKKDELGRAIKKLQAGEIRQRLLIEKNGTASLFASHQGTGKIFSIGGI